MLTFVPQKAHTKLKIRMSKTSESEDLKTKIEESGPAAQYEEMKRRSGYRFLLDNSTFKNHAPTVKDLVAHALKTFDD